MCFKITIIVSIMCLFIANDFGKFIDYKIPKDAINIHISQKYKLPTASKFKPPGLVNLAKVAGPPSPLKP